MYPTGDMKEVGRLVRYHRARANLSRVDLATIAGVGKTVIYDIEHGKETVQFATLRSVLRALNIQIGFESPLMAAFVAEERESQGEEDN